MPPPSPPIIIYKEASPAPPDPPDQIQGDADGADDDEEEEEEEEEEQQQVDGGQLMEVTSMDYGSEGESDFNLSEVSVELPFPGFVPLSMRCMDQESRLRNLCLRMITNPWFERISMMVILFNCVTLGMYQPCVDEDCVTNRCKILQMFDDFIFAFFAIEMLIKMVAMGIYGKGAYLADSWNRLDFFIVIAGAIEYCLGDNMNLTAIRTIRVLRPLRAINRIPSMRILVMLLLDTLPMLGNVLLLCFFVFFIFGIVGVQLWSGTLRQRCFFNETVKNTMNIPIPLANYYRYQQDIEKDYICSLPKDNGMHRCEDLPLFRYNEMECNETAQNGSDNMPTAYSCVNWNQYYTTCDVSDANPFQGAISFDNIGLAWVAIFLVISLEGWTDIMYYVQDAHSFWDWIYFVLLIVIGSFFMINLCLVVIATQFSETKKREMERMRLERARYQSTSTLASTTTSEPASCYAQIVKYVAHLWRRSKRRWARYWKNRRRNQNQRQQVPSLKRKRRRRAPGEAAALTTAEADPPVSQCYNNSSSSSNNNNNNNDPSDDSGPCTKENRSACVPHVLSHAPRASPEVSDIDPVASPRKPILLKVPSGTNGSSEGDMAMAAGASGGEESGTGSMTYLNPTPQSQRRRSSVMFSDVVLLHGENGASSEALNVCSRERTTQTDDQWRPRSFSFAFFQRPSTGGLAASPLTCPELLALSGALHATLPTHLGSDMTQLLGKDNKLHLSAPALSVPDAPAPKAIVADDTSGDGDWSGSEVDDFVDDADWSEEEQQLVRKPSCLCVIWDRIHKVIKALVEHKYFQQGILFAILINTLSMGIEHHKQPKELTMMVETSNIVFSAIFVIEMLLKLIAEGLLGYLSNGFNVFDGIIVVLSVVELSQGLSAGGAENAGNSSLSVLRTFRLLRILKLVRFLPNLRRQLFVMLRTMDNVAVFFALLVLFIFIFSVLGMYLFGGKFCMLADGRNCPCAMIVSRDPRCICDRKHFNNFLWATVTVFQILTQEDWNVVLFNGMKTSHWAALYFVALMTFGNYVLFNLLVAILVEGFSAERNERVERELRELAKRQREQAKLEALMAAESQLQEHAPEAPDSASDSEPAFSSEVADPEECKRAGLDPEGGGQSGKSNANGSKECEKKSWTPKPTRLTYGYDDEGEPKCNIEKETKMLQQPSLVVALKGESKAGGELPLCLPPIITHTAATPQGSPHATLDTPLREWGTRLTPSMALYASCGSSIDSIDKSTSSQASASSLQRTQSTKSASRVPRRDSLNPEMPASSLHGVARRDSLSPGPSPGTTPSLQHRRSRCSWRGVRSSFHVSKDGDGSGSDADGEEEAVLNNGRSARSHQSSHSGERLHCNGGVPGVLPNATQNTPNNKRPMPCSPRTLSPQNSIKSNGSSPRSPLALTFAQLPWAAAPSPQTTIHNPVSRQDSLRSHPRLTPQNSLPSPHTPSRQNSVKELSVAFKPNNLAVEAALGVAAPASPKEEEEKGLLRLWHRLLQPPACLKDRENHSLYLFNPENSFRQLCIWTVNRPWFDHGILFFIGFNCITLAMERPRIPPDSIERMFLAASNYVFTAVFALEMLVKVIATGMVYGPEAYFNSGWNIMDGALVTISIVDFLMSVISAGSPRIFGILRVFRLLRSLRPLRVINRAPGLKLVVQTLLSSLRPIGNIVLICCTFFIIFGILGVQLFKGMFYYCEGSVIDNVVTREDCEKVGTWVNRKYNFDDLGQALMALFVLSSKDGWVNIMYSGLDAVAVDKQPIENFSEWRLLYFISFLLLVGFFVLNMFVGVVVENFHRCREEQEREEKARRAAKRAKKMAKKRRSELEGVPPSSDSDSETEAEARARKARERRRKEMHQPPYYLHYSRPRLFLHSMVTSKYFDLAIAAVIGLNVVTMATEFYKMPKALEYSLMVFNYFFTAVFILELAMKLIALGTRRYLKDKWNQLDVFIVILSVVGIVLEEMKSGIIPINPTIIRVMRVLRIARVLKLLKMAKGIRALLDTVMQALPQVGNLGLLFFLLFFIFAALGVELFGRLECDEKFPCQGLSEHAHFGNFGIAFLTLFRVATGDNWNGIMKDTLRDKCDSRADCIKNCCVSHFIAPIFFVVFVLMAQFVLVNVVVAVLMKHLEESHKQMEDELDMEAELEQELAAEEALAELQEQLHVAKAIEAATEFELELRPRGHRPLGKMNSLPANFTFPSIKPGNGGAADRELAASVCGGSARNSLTAPAPEPTTSDTCDPIAVARNSINIRQPSPDEVADKVAVADLRTTPRGSSPARVGSVPSLYAEACSSATLGQSGRRSLPGSQLSLAVHLQSRGSSGLSSEVSPDCTSAAVTLVPPKYPARTPSTPNMGSDGDEGVPAVSLLVPPPLYSQCAGRVEGKDSAVVLNVVDITCTDAT